MSIDLVIDTPTRLQFGPLVPTLSAVLQEILGLSSAPDLHLSELRHGRATAPATDVLSGDADSPWLFVSVNVAGKRTAAGIMGGDGHLTVTATTRTPLGLVLAATMAIVVARAVGAESIEDTIEVFRQGLTVAPDDLLAALKLPRGAKDPQEAAARIALFQGDW